MNETLSRGASDPALMMVPAQFTNVAPSSDTPLWFDAQGQALHLAFSMSTNSVMQLQGMERSVTRNDNDDDTNGHLGSTITLMSNMPSDGCEIAAGELLEHVAACVIQNTFRRHRARSLQLDPTSAGAHQDTKDE